MVLYPWPGQFLIIDVSQLLIPSLKLVQREPCHAGLLDQALGEPRAPEP